MSPKFVIIYHLWLSWVGSQNIEEACEFPCFCFFVVCFFFFYFITKIALRYSWFILLYWLQVYNILIQYCYRLFSIYVTIKRWLYSLCYTTYPHSLFLLNSSLYLLIFYPMPLTPSLSPLATTDLFSISVSLFLFCYIQLFVF